MPNEKIHHYLSSLDSHLSPLPSQDRAEIIAEIEAHIIDSLRDSSKDIGLVLRRLGSPETLAALFKDQIAIQQPGLATSPIRLMSVAIRFAGRGILAFVAMLIGFCGYITALSVALLGFLKPITPLHMGVWVQDGRIVRVGSLTSWSAPQPHDVLGWMIVPLALAVGIGITLLTTAAMKFCLRESTKFQNNALPSGAPGLLNSHPVRGK